MIAPGSIAPDFSLPDQDGNIIRLSDFSGKNVLLLFYPRDNSFTCTKQFCEYRDDWQQIKSRGIAVFGINEGSPESHKKFKDRNALPFPLLSDADESVTKKYGAKAIIGLTKRSYVLISAEGKILFAESEIIPYFKKSLDDLIKLIDKKLSVAA